jgi:hypothetical protein
MKAPARMRIGRCLALAVAVAVALPFAAHAQSPSIKKPGKIVCGSFSGDPKKWPAWNDEMEIVIDAGTLTAKPARPTGHVMRGTVGSSGAILVAGEGGLEDGTAEWTYEFAGKLNPRGITVIRGELADIKGGPAKRNCSISF